MRPLPKKQYKNRKIVNRRAHPKKTRVGRLREQVKQELVKSKELTEEVINELNSPDFSPH